MHVNSGVRPAARWLTAGAILGVASWAAYAGVEWIRYGHARRRTRPAEADPLLDQFMPTYEVVDRHRICIAAPREITFAAATGLDLRQSMVIRAVFKSRGWMLGSKPEKTVLPGTLLDWAKALGWRVLAEIPGREVVVGAVTRPWEANVVFRAIPPGEFAGFHEPGYVKIAWTLRADPASATESVARTETRATTTDSGARARFRRYWACLSAGMRLIRRIALKMLKREAERCALQPARALVRQGLTQ